MLSRSAGARIILAMWALPPRQILLEPESVHIWRAPLTLPAEKRERLEDLLSTEERAQCSRLVRDADRLRCVASRGSLRTVLGKYLGEDPRALSLTKGTSGKPVLEGANPQLQFNVSNSGDLGLIAVTRKLRVGIDIERIRDVPNWEGVLNDFFSPEETTFVQSRRGKERTRAFFLLWTRREAAAKALGIDLFDCFARVVLPAPDHTPSGFRVKLPDPDAPAGPTRDWWLRDLLPAAGYAGAVCVERENAAPTFWKLPNRPISGISKD
jgi:4'-phosphopantetheinyl transferase